MTDEQSTDTTRSDVRELRMAPLGDRTPVREAPSRLSPVDARDLTDRIRVGVEAVWELVKRAYVSRAWSVLGYDSWDEYCTREFGNSRLRLPREERSEVLPSLRESGMSMPAIAAATGMSVGAVHSNLSELKGSGRVSEPAVVVGSNGKSYAPSAPSPSPGAALQESGVRRPARRRPIIESFWQATHTLTKDTERIARLASDDRFARNSSQIAGSHLSDLVRARDAVQRVIDLLRPGG